MPRDGEPKNDLLTLPEAAELLRLKTSTLRAWILQRRIRFVKLGRLVRIRRSDAEALITSCIVEAGNAPAI
jgi:excisionase family DNA binding protein